MKKSSLIVVVTLMAFTGIYAQEDQRQEDQTYFERFKDALASDEIDTAEPIPAENEGSNLEVFNDQSDDQEIPTSSDESWDEE